MNKNMLVSGLIKFVVFMGSLLFFINMVRSQVIYQTDNRFEADYVVYVTTNKFEADWMVYMTKNRFEAKNGIMCVTDNT